MAALNFPPSPSTNQIYSANGKSWRFDGTSWKTFYILNVQGGGTGNTFYNLGDILVGAGTSLYPLPIGSNNYVLTVDNSAAFGVTWRSTAATGITTLNSLTSTSQFFSIGYSGNFPNVSSLGSTHTFNIPIAGTGSTGLVSTLAQTFAGSKTFTSAIIGDLTGTATTATYAHQAGYAITSGSSNSSGFATTASNLNVSSASTGTFYPVLSNTSSSVSGIAASVNSFFSFNVATGAFAATSVNILSGQSYNVGGNSVLSATSLGTGVTNSYITSLGTITTGVWSGSLITAYYGGTGYNTYTKGDILVGAGNTFIKLNVGTDNYVLTASSLSSTGLTWSPTAATGLTTLNGLNSGVQYLAFGYSGTVPAFSSSGSTHTLNIPLAGTGSTGLVSTQAQSFAGIKTFTNAVSITDSTGSGSYTSGALTIAGGVGIGGTLNVQGDLNIQGTFTTINSTTITVADKNIELGVVATPTDLTAEGGGITLRGATNKSINWYSGVGWSSSESWNLASGNTFKINGTNVLSSNTLGTGVIFSSIQTAGIITSGTWAATAITALYGGTGLVPTFTVGDILYANTSSTWGRLTANSNSGFVLVSAGSGATPTYVNPNTLSVGFASTATYSYQSGYAITSGLATTASYSHQSGYAITSGSAALATTATYAHQSGYAITSGFATTASYSYQSGYGLTSGLATTANYSHQSGYAITSGSSSTSAFATTAANLNVSSAVSGLLYPVLSNTASSASGIGASVNSYFTFNASSGAFGATSVNILSGQSYSIGGNSVLSATSLGTGVTNSSLTAVGTITTGVWAGTLITGLYGGTGYNSYTKGDILVGAGSTFIKVNVGTDNFVLVADATTASGVKWNSIAGLSITSVNGLTASAQFFSTGTSGTGFNIASSGSTHTFNIPIAGTGATGLVSTLAQSFAGVKTFTNDVVVSSSTISTSTSTGAITVTGGVGIGGSLFTGTSTADSISGVVLNNGVITTGSWSATAITARYGGTGNTSYTLGDLLVGAGSTFIKLPVGINSYVLGADSSRPSGVGWTSVTPLTISDTPPASPKNADLWFNSVDGGLLVYYSDVDTNQWVEIALGSGIDLSQPVHITNTTASTSTTTGALIVDGGAGFASTIYAPVISINGIYDQISSTLTTSSTTADQVAMSLGATVYRTLKLNVQMTSSTSYHSQEILMVHDGTLVYMTEYAIVNNGSILSTFDADISGGNIRLLVSPTNAVTTYKIACSAIRI